MQWDLKKVGYSSWLHTISFKCWRNTKCSVSVCLLLYYYTSFSFVVVFPHSQSFFLFPWRKRGDLVRWIKRIENLFFVLLLLFFRILFFATHSPALYYIIYYICTIHIQIKSYRSTKECLSLVLYIMFYFRSAWQITMLKKLHHF